MMAAFVAASSYNYPAGNDRKLKSSGGRGGGGRSGGRSRSGGSSWISGGSTYRGYSGGYSNVGYLSFGAHAYASYYSYAYYGGETGRHECWDANLECIEDTKRR